MDRPIFEKAAGLKDDEIMPIVSPLGYPSDERSDVDIKLRDSVHGDDRIEVAEMFFEGDFNRPLDAIDDGTKDIVETVIGVPDGTEYIASVIME